MASSGAPRLGLQWNSRTRQALVGYTIDNTQIPVYATVSLTLDVGKRTGTSAYKRQNPELKKVLRCYTSDKHVKPRVISNAAVNLDQLVNCLKPFGKGWQNKVKDDFSIEFSTYIQEFSCEKLNGARPEPTKYESLQDDEETAITDPEEAAEHDSFDVKQTIRQEVLGQAAKALQQAFNLNKAPSIALLESMGNWLHQTELAARSCPQCSSVFEPNSHSLSPEPELVQYDLDIDIEERMNSMWDDVMTPNITREVKETLHLLRR